MSDNNDSQWSSKFKQFGITDPFLKLFTIKYDKSIPWQTVVKDEFSLNQYIKDVLLPDLKKKTTWNKAYNQSAESLFVDCDDLDVEQILKTDEFSDWDFTDITIHLNDIDHYDEYFRTGQINCSFEQHETICREFASFELTIILNNRKEEAFTIWFDVLQKKYPKNIAFQYLVLKPIIEQSGYNSRQLLPAPDNVILKWLYFRIQSEYYKPSNIFGKEYNICLSND